MGVKSKIGKNRCTFARSRKAFSFRVPQNMTATVAWEIAIWSTELLMILLFIRSQMKQELSS